MAKVKAGVNDLQSLSPNIAKELHPTLNEKLRDKSGRIAYLIGLLIICISEVVFSILGNAGIISNHKVIVLYLFVLLLVQIVIGKVVYRQLRKKY